MRAHAATTRRFNSQLVADHGLTINDYEVLLHLSHAEGRRLRRVDLAERVLLTPSGITRLLEGLEHLQVTNARRKGWSWQEIADALEVTRQGVHKKHAHLMPAHDAREG